MEGRADAGSPLARGRPPYKVEPHCRPSFPRSGSLGREDVGSPLARGSPPYNKVIDQLEKANAEQV